MERYSAHREAIEPRITPEAAPRARKVRMILMDVDGVLTDGRIVFSGPVDETKFFDAQDGVGIRLARNAGLEVGLITGRASQALERRARELGVTEIHQRSLRKADAFAKVLSTHRLDAGAVAFIGDDIVDLPVMRRAGFAASVPNARPEVRESAHFVSSRAGGRGAVRQILDFILMVQGRWERVTRGYV